MHGLETLTRLNREPFVVDDNPLNNLVRDADGNAVPGHPLRDHPRIRRLRAQISGMGLDGSFKAHLYDSLYRYAHQIVARPVYLYGEGMGNLEALQQVSLGDLWERGLMRYSRLGKG